MIITSRLLKKEEARNLRKTFVYGFLAIFLVVGLIFGGIPLLVKIAIFFADIKSSSTPIEQTDTIPPAPPILNSLPEAVNADNLRLSGFAEAGSTVEIFLNGSSTVKVVASEDGTFFVDKIVLAEGRNEIYALSQDQAGNTSQSSSKTFILLDKTAPVLEINEPQNNAIITGENRRKVQIIGKTDPGVTLLFNDHLEIVDREGNFKITYSLTEGENVLKFSATDLAGNKTEKELKINFSL